MPPAPFVLLDDMRPGGSARLFHGLARSISAHTPSEVRPAIERLRGAMRQGFHAAGFLSFEAGHALEPRLSPRRMGEGDPPLLWFGLFEQADAVDPAAMLPDPAGAWAGPPEPLVSREDYGAAFDRVKAYIAAGDIYQANLTFPAHVRLAGDPMALYARIRASAGAGWGGVAFTGERWLLSFSPEMFFALAGGRLSARPMKGTARRLDDPAADRAAAEALAADPKQRAENLMIVDLLRNDLSRVATPGSVETPALFEVESYPTVHQMTSTVTADLAEGMDAIDVIEAIFPCGSVTGAPKIRAMEIIREVEAGPRGVYTGSIGHIDPDGSASFNVAIRTLAIDADGAGDGAGAVMGLGSGVVADSEVDSEWRECADKGRFVTANPARFDLIETMRFDAQEGVVDLDRHMARMKASADVFGFAFDRHDVRNELQAATFRLRDDRRIRLVVSASGQAAIEVRPMPAAFDRPLAVTLTPLRNHPADFRLRHKTTDRAFYDEARRALGTDEVVFVDREGHVTEGSFTTVFVERDGVMWTPPLARGLLPGVLRDRLIEEGRAVEHEILPDDLADGFLLGNALRGLMPARLVAAASPPGL